TLRPMNAFHADATASSVFLHTPPCRRPWRRAAYALQRSPPSVRTARMLGRRTPVANPNSQHVGTIQMKFDSAGLSVAATLATLFAAGPASAQGQVNVYNWSDYIAEDAVDNFAKATGIKVNYSVYDSNESLDAKLRAGKSGYDVVYPTASPFL